MIIEMSANAIQAMGHVALVSGGDSAEREISLKGAKAVSRALTRLGVEFTEVDGPRRLLEQVAAGHFDRVFNLLHGRGGEDGALQGALRLYGVPVTGSSVLASALTMSKVQTKRVWQAVGLPTPRYQLCLKEHWVLADGQLLEDKVDALIAQIGLPMFIKPNREGSSLGMSRVLESSQCAEALLKAFEFDSEVLVEQMIQGRELTCGILHDRALPLIELRTPNAFYDFDAKYASGTTEYLCPAPLSSSLTQGISELCLKAFQVVGAQGWGRVDVMIDGQEKPWLLEVNTTPGMTESSLLPKAAAQAGMTFEELVWEILSQAKIA
jgi:D-alanine-D-alanine ligase